MALELSTRLATAADIPSLLTLVQSAYRGESSRRGWTTEANILDDQRIDEAQLLKKLSTPQDAILLWHDPSGALIACIEVARRTPLEGETTPVASVGLYAVDPTKQAGGIGKRVLAAAEAFAAESWAVQTLEMHVLTAREELIAFYVRRGYVKTGERKPYSPTMPDGRVVHLEFEVLRKAVV